MAKGPRRPNELETPLGKLREIVEQLKAQAPGLSPRRAILLREKITGALDELSRLATDLDTIKEPTSIFDPSNPTIIGRFIAIALLAQERVPLNEVPQFYGSGVYALYYDGKYTPYRPLVGTENPIYVGKTDPAIATARNAREQGTSLSRRLRSDHARSIRKAETTLRVDDFSCRFLVVKSGGQSEAENYLIHLFRPIWNNEIGICYGIGKHGDAPETRSNKRSPWDTLHPGRTWAHRDVTMKDAIPENQIVDSLARHFRSFPPYRDVNAVLEKFYAELRQR